MAKLRKYVDTILKKNIVPNRTFLAGLLGVTERSLTDWEKMDTNNYSPKAKRLILLNQIISLMCKEFPDSNHYDLLCNSRIVIDPKDKEDGEISLINFILSDPDNTFWYQISKSAITDYISGR